MGEINGGFRQIGPGHGLIQAGDRLVPFQRVKEQRQTLGVTAVPGVFQVVRKQMISRFVKRLDDGGFRLLIKFLEVELQKRTFLFQFHGSFDRAKVEEVVDRRD